MRRRRHATPVSTSRHALLAGAILAVLATSGAIGAPQGPLAGSVNAAARPIAYQEGRSASLRSPLLGGTVRTVQNCNDSGNGSLREAYLASVDGDTVDLGQLACSTITLTSGELQSNGVVAYVAITGNRYTHTTIDANLAGRAFHHAGGRLRLAYLEVRGGRVADASGGGCVRSFGDVVVHASSLTDCEVSTTGTTPARGGAIQADGVVFLSDSVVSGNRATAEGADADGGGVHARYIAGANGCTISGNTASGDGTHHARGGGLHGREGVRIDECTISGNRAIRGGGAYVGDASYYNSSFTNVTISGNEALGAGGGVFSWFSVRLDNSTVTANRAVFDFGAGVYLAAGNATLHSAIVAGNTSGDGLVESDIGGHPGAVVNGGHNLVRASTLPLPPDTLASDPMLGPLQDNGGQVRTHALLPGSPAIDAGDNPRSLWTDARQYACSDSGCVQYERTLGAGTDIGAFELGGPDRIFDDGFDSEA